MNIIYSMKTNENKYSMKPNENNKFDEISKNNINLKKVK